MDTFKLKVGAFILAILITINISFAASIIFLPLFVIEDDMMRVNTGNEETISLIQFFDSTSKSLVEEKQGCFTSECIFDIEHLSAQTYIVNITTNEGNIFSQQVVIE
jgi:uncharacterized membrane protein